LTKIKFRRTLKKSKYRVIGLMSGTSLDGLDIACCTFIRIGNSWTYRIECAETTPYPAPWREVLSTLQTSTALDFAAADADYGHLLGTLARTFMEKFSLRPDFIASHGHTIFHQPGLMLTSQIGSGACIAAETGLPVICDFRSLDVALGGQGAPLVPIGDQLLFGSMDFCLNLGGFANISFDNNGSRTAYDICPANIVLNHLAQQAGREFDPGGLIASGGTIDPTLLERLNTLPFYRQSFPKSLGREWVVQHVFPLLSGSGLPVHDLLATFCEHIAIQVAAAAGDKPGTNMLVTGGGAFNDFLVSRIRHHSIPGILIPDPDTVNYKEALIFAFLGLLKWRNEINCLKSVTGATRDSSGGAIY